MELSKQVCSLEQAKKLKELGVEQKTSFYYVIRVECTQPETRVTRDMAIDAGDMSYDGSIYQEAQFEQTLSLEYGDITKSDCEFYAAFTDAELGIMLHNYNSTYLPILDSKFKAEAEYRADRLIACIPELITVEEVNARLTA